MLKVKDGSCFINIKIVEIVEPKCSECCLHLANLNRQTGRQEGGQMGGQAEVRIGCLHYQKTEKCFA